MVPIKDDKLNSPVADDDEGGVGDVDVGEPAVAVVDSVFDSIVDGYVPLDQLLGHPEL